LTSNRVFASWTIRLKSAMVRAYRSGDNIVGSGG
jgi:hypothetical protein